MLHVQGIGLSNCKEIECLNRSLFELNPPEIADLREESRGGQTCLKAIEDCLYRIKQSLDLALREPKRFAEHEDTAVRLPLVAESTTACSHHILLILLTEQTCRRDQPDSHKFSLFSKLMRLADQLIDDTIYLCRSTSSKVLGLG